MKKELILLTFMTAGPYLLNSAGLFSQQPDIRAEPVSFNVSLTESEASLSLFKTLSHYYRDVNIPAKEIIGSDTNKIIEDRPPARVLTTRRKTLSREAIKANWILDTLASDQDGTLIYIDKDNPKLRAIINTDESGNMIIRLERDGEIIEMPVDKIEFHSGSHFKLRGRKNKTLKSVIQPEEVILEKQSKADNHKKGGAYVPV